MQGPFSGSSVSPREQRTIFMKLNHHLATPCSNACGALEISHVDDNFSFLIFCLLFFFYFFSFLLFFLFLASFFSSSTSSSSSSSSSFSFFFVFVFFQFFLVSGNVTAWFEIRQVVLNLAGSLILKSRNLLYRIRVKF